MKPFTMTWEKWKGLMLNELSQRKTDTKYHTIAFTCEFSETKQTGKGAQGGMREASQDTHSFFFNFYLFMIVTQKEREAET